MTLSTSAIRATATTPCDTPAEIDVSASESDTRARATSDAETAHRIATLVDAFVGDLFSLIEATQSRTRDTTSATQERIVVNRGLAGRDAHLGRVAELEQATADRARAAESGQVSDVLRWVGVGLSVAIGALGSVFSGGATLVAAVAIAVALTATCVLQGCAQAGLVGAEAAAVANLVISGVATLVSLGCATASLISAATSTATTVAVAAANTASAATSAAAETARSALDLSRAVTQIVAGLNAITQGSFEIGAAVVTGDAASHENEATELQHSREAENECRDAALDALTDLARSFARVAQSMSEVRDEAVAARRAALRFA